MSTLLSMFEGALSPLTTVIRDCKHSMCSLAVGQGHFECDNWRTASTEVSDGENYLHGPYLLDGILDAVASNVGADIVYILIAR